MPLFGGSINDFVIPTGTSGWYGNQTTACTTASVWCTNTIVTSSTTCTNTIYYDAVLQHWYNNQLQQAAANAYNSQAQQYIQPQISNAELQRRAKQREQSQYDKAIAEHNEQEAARLRRLIDARAAREAEQAARNEQLRIEREAREAQRRIEYEAEQTRRTAANQRAEELLIEHLTEEQRDTFQKNKWFIIEGGRTKQKYRAFRVPK